MTDRVQAKKICSSVVMNWVSIKI